MKNTKKTTISTIYDNINYEQDEYAFDDECMNLDKQLDNRIIAIADLGLWNGRKQGYKICSNNLNEIMYAGNEDYISVYYDGYNVRKKAIHYDGTNYILFRELKPNVNVDKFCNKIYNGEYIDTKTLCRYTTSLKKYVKKVYGF